MIKNDKQLNVSKDWLQKFEKDLAGLDNIPDLEPLQKEIQLSAFKSSIWKLEKEIFEYERVKSGNINSLSIPEFRLCHVALINARIAKGWTQAELAEKVGLKEQQIQRYEATNYSTASMPRIDEIMFALGINISLYVTGLGKHRFAIPAEFADKIEGIEEKVRVEKTLLQLA